MIRHESSSLEAGRWVEEKTGLGKTSIWVAEGWDCPAFREFLLTVDDHLDAGETVFKERNHLVRFQANSVAGVNQDIIVKSFRLQRIYDQLRFHFLESKATRALNIALAMLSLRVKTPRPVAVVEERGRLNRLLRSVLVTEYLADAFSMLHFDDATPMWPKIRRCLPQIALDMRRMHDAGIVHNDFHGGNILVKQRRDDLEFYYIDLNRARTRGKLTLQQRMNDLVRFELNKEDLAIFLRSYWPEQYERLHTLYRRSVRRRARRLALKTTLRKIFGIG